MVRDLAIWGATTALALGWLEVQVRRQRRAEARDRVRMLRALDRMERLHEEYRRLGPCPDCGSSAVSQYAGQSEVCCFGCGRVRGHINDLEVSG